MEILVERILFAPTSTIGNLSIDGKFMCDTLEDTDRGLDSQMTLEELSSRKVKAETAIPYGRYAVAMQWSPHFGKLMPHLLHVPVYDFIMIHPLNTPAQTEGCIGVGTMQEVDFISGSRQTFEQILPLIVDALGSGQEVWCEVKRKELQPAGLDYGQH